MKKENHNEEIRATRVGGFGGSDAQLLLDIAAVLREHGPLTLTQKRRLRVAKGLDAPAMNFSTTDIDVGRAFEDEVAARLKDNPQGLQWTREAFLTRAEVFPRNFAVFAHADFCDIPSMSVKEVKWTRVLTMTGLIDKYAAQLQWYYLLGANSVSLVYHCENHGEPLQGCIDIPRDNKKIQSLKDAVRLIDENWNVMDLDIKEVRENELPPSVRVSVEELINATRKKREIERKIEILKETISVYFIETTSRRILGDSWSLSYKDANEKLVFDEKNLAASYPDLYASFLVKLSKNKASINVNLK